MLAKLTSKNQLTLPARAVDQLGRPTFFEVAVEDGRLVLTPARVVPARETADAVRAKLEALGIGEDDVRAAVAAARR
jgi:hypothetical protein